MSERVDLARAWEVLQKGDFKQAEALSRDALLRSPRDAEAVHLLGLARKEAGDLGDAERLLRTSIELEPRRAEFRANLGNLLQRQSRFTDAVVAYREALSQDPTHHPARLGLARALSDMQDFAGAEAECRKLIAAGPRDARHWSILGSALRGQSRMGEAEAAFRQGIALAPNRPQLHHNLGALLSNLERSEEAIESLDRAQAFGLNGREIAVNRGRTLVQLYRLEEAEVEYARAVAIMPRDLDAQLSLAQLRYMRGDPNFAREIAAAAASRNEPSLRLMHGDVLRRAGDLKGAEAVLRDYIAQRGPLPEVRASLAAVLQELGQLREAETEALEAAAQRPNNPAVIETLVAIQLSQGRGDEATPFIARQRALQPLEQRWIAYEATAARLRGVARYNELYDYQRFVRAYDIAPPAGYSSMEELNTALAAALATRHRFATHPLGQSLRNGSQTARSLLAERDPAIQAVLAAFAPAIDDYRRFIGSDPAHPLTSRNRGEARYAGAWSVQLQREGFHVNHLHPAGWISSAYYVSVPTEVENEDLRSGWLKFGEPRFAVPGASPERYVQPKPGRLVLFPSYMWHGTNPIHGPEPRMSVAFDVVPKAEAT
jgi:Flp pilus assembly protein TadD